MQIGVASLMAKIDIKSAYRLVPVHLHDRIWLRMKWEGSLYVDGMLPFGLRSPPKIFSATSDALEWCIARKGVNHIYHYIDDFIVLGHPGSDSCARSLHTLESECAALGVPLAPLKKVGPTPIIPFLGIEINTTDGLLRLPAYKLLRLIEMVNQWSSRRSCTRRDLESPIGSLQHACKVIPAGRSFMRRAIALLNRAKKPHHHIRLTQEFRADLLWWKAFAPGWNGTSLIINTASQSDHPIILTSDASDWGCRAWWGTEWLQLQWDQQSCAYHINIKELIPVLIAIAIAVWGKFWLGRRVLCNCDNQTVVTALNHRYCREGNIMHLLRCLFFWKLISAATSQQHTSLAA